jgi:hypothetical protein
MDRNKAVVIETGGLYVVWCDGRAHYFEKIGEKAKYWYDCNCKGPKHD